MINVNNNPEHPENENREPELLIAKSPFKSLGIDVEVIFKDNLLKTFENLYELKFDNPEEIEVFAKRVTELGHKSLNNNLEIITEALLKYKQKFNSGNAPV